MELMHECFPKHSRMGKAIIKKKSRRPITTKSKYYNNKHNTEVFYKIWNKCNEMEHNTHTNSAVPGISSLLDISMTFLAGFSLVVCSGAAVAATVSWYVPVRGAVPWWVDVSLLRSAFGVSLCQYPSSRRASLMPVSHAPCTVLKKWSWVASPQKQTTCKMLKS